MEKSLFDRFLEYIKSELFRTRSTRFLDFLWKKLEKLNVIVVWENEKLRKKYTQTEEYLQSAWEIFRNTPFSPLPNTQALPMLWNIEKKNVAEWNIILPDWKICIWYVFRGIGTIISCSVIGIIVFLFLDPVGFLIILGKIFWIETPIDSLREKWMFEIRYIFWMVLLFPIVHLWWTFDMYRMIQNFSMRNISLIENSVLIGNTKISLSEIYGLQLVSEFIKLSKNSYWNHQLNIITRGWERINLIPKTINHRAYFTKSSEEIAQFIGKPLFNPPNQEFFGEDGVLKKFEEISLIKS